MIIGQFVSFGMGGADKAAYNLVRGLTEIGDQVKVFYWSKSLPPPHLPSRLGHYAPFNPTMVSSPRQLFNHDLTVLNTHRPGSDTYFLPPFDKTRFPFKVVETNFHGCFSSKADRRVFPSEALASFSQGNSDPKNVVIPNPILPPVVDSNLREELGIGDKFVFGRIARPDQEIYTSINLSAYKLVENDNTVFLYAGPCSIARTDAANMGIKNIIFLDITIDENRVSQIYNTMDVLCHSNAIGETFGNTIAEAMMHGRPVLSHNGHPNWTQAQPELLGDLAPELYVCQGDLVSGYAARMEKLMTDKEYYRGAQSYLQSRAKDNFHYLVVAKKYHDLYQSA